jgi:hypothetical protein
MQRGDRPDPEAGAPVSSRQHLLHQRFVKNLSADKHVAGSVPEKEIMEAPEQINERAIQS